MKQGAYVVTALDPDGPGARGGLVKGTKLLAVDGTLLHAWIILVIVKQHLVRLGRIDGRDEAGCVRGDSFTTR